MRDFTGIDLSRESVPNATTQLDFRRLLERFELTEAIFEQIGEHIQIGKAACVKAPLWTRPSSRHLPQGEPFRWT